jgi:hypothetical protein
VVIGMTVADVAGRAITNLEVDRLVQRKPTFIGDTLLRSRSSRCRSGITIFGIVIIRPAIPTSAVTRCAPTRSTCSTAEGPIPTLGEGKLPY